MTQKDKKLLIKDLCSRLPYNVKVKISSMESPLTVLSINTNGVTWVKRNVGYPFEIDWENCKPYLFPLSSMTEEQMFDFATVQAENCKGSYPTLSECSAIIDWGYKHHFDVNGLIEKGLAIDATELNIY